MIQARESTRLESQSRESLAPLNGAESDTHVLFRHCSTIFIAVDQESFI